MRRDRMDGTIPDDYYWDILGTIMHEYNVSSEDHPDFITVQLVALARTLRTREHGPS